MTAAHPRTVVAVWNELTPYRLHVMHRVARELPEVRVTNVFTHSVEKNSSPWMMETSGGVNIEFDEANRVPGVEQFAHARALRLVASIEKVIRRERPVFVLMHGHNDLTRVALIHRLRWARIPMVHASDANVFAEHPPSGMRRLLTAGYRAYRSHLLRMMDGYMPMGIAGRAFYDLYGRPEAPRFIFPYEPDYSALADVGHADEQEFRERQGLIGGQHHFLCSSRLVPVKNVDVAIRAFCRVAGEQPGWNLLIAGDGPLRHRLQALVPPHLNGRVKFLGFLQMQQLRIAYKLADCLVHASSREPWALVINEAANADLPIISTDITGAAIELVRDGVNGRLVRPGCETSLANAMRWIASRPDLGPQRSASRRLLSEWRASADPVAGFRSAVEHFSALNVSTSP